MYCTVYILGRLTPGAKSGYFPRNLDLFYVDFQKYFRLDSSNSLSEFLEKKKLNL